MHHLPDESRHFDAVGFHDPSLTEINFIPTSENTTVVNIHPPPRIRATPFVNRYDPPPRVLPSFSTFNNTTFDNTLDDTINDPTEDDLDVTQSTRV